MDIWNERDSNCMTDDGPTNDITFTLSGTETFESDESDSNSVIDGYILCSKSDCTDCSSTAYFSSHNSSGSHDNYYPCNKSQCSQSEFYTCDESNNSSNSEYNLATKSNFLSCYDTDCDKTKYNSSDAKEWEFWLLLGDEANKFEPYGRVGGLG